MNTKSFKSTLKFAVSGVRGIIGEGMTPRLAGQLGASFGDYQGMGRIVVGRDTRPSGSMIADATIAGLLSVGCQVIDLGVVPTPTVQLMVREMGASGGIAVTASHNPSEWNALKFIGGEGLFLNQAEARELFNIFSQGSFEYVAEDKIRDVVVKSNAFEHHTKRLLKTVDVRNIMPRKFRVAIDCCNGVGAVWSAKFLRALGCQVFAINDAPDGVFGRNPEPIPEALSELSDLVVKERCDIGFAQDPDGDRLTVVDNRGRILNQQMTLVLALDHVLEAFPGPVVVNLQTTHLVEKIAKECGSEVFYAPVGEINVVQEMRERGARIGGEGNCGGVIWTRVHSGRDSYAAMALLLEMLALANGTLSDIVDSIPPCFMISEKIAMEAREAMLVVEVMRRKYSDLDILTMDGLRINSEDGWVLIRFSNTEPILRLTVECESEVECAKRVELYRAEIEDILKTLRGEF